MEITNFLFVCELCETLTFRFSLLKMLSIVSSLTNDCGIFFLMDM